MTSELWYDKYRPLALEDYVWEDSNSGLKERMEYWILSPEELPHLIFEGPPGTGKTSLALLLISLLELSSRDFMFINTNKHGGVDAIRDDITNFCEVGGFNAVKLVIIDEADGLSIQAQDKLRGVINDYGSWVRFILTCNKIRSLSDAIKSRARCFRINALNPTSFYEKLETIVSQESLTSENTEEILSQIVENTYPDLRKAIDLLQNSSVKGKLISPNEQISQIPDWQKGIGNIILNKGTPTEVRELVSSLKYDEIDEVFRYLYERTTVLFPDDVTKEQVAVVLIAEYLKVHKSVAFPEINLAGLIIKLIGLRKTNE